jgi:DNA-binding XRE family transcriptional regulator
MSDVTSMRTNDELIAEQLRADPEFRAEWERTARGRALAVALVRYRAEHSVSQREVAGLLGMTKTRLAHLELGEGSPSADTLVKVSSRLGIDVAS